MKFGIGYVPAFDALGPAEVAVLAAATSRIRVGTGICLVVERDPIVSWPKPVQRPHPPVLVGGHGPHVLDRVLTHGDGLLPNWGRLGEDLFGRIAELRARAERELEVAVIGVPADPALLARMRAAGVDRAIAWMPTAERGGVEGALDAWAAATGHLR